MKDHFLFFSPEIFVKIEGGKIYSYPMKGTRDATLPDACKQLQNDEKEICEHATIIDLIRNDLSMVATDVAVIRYRYIERLETNRGPLLQASSEISGRLPDGWKSRLGDLLLRLLPAGFISGAPKKKTCEIIEEAETSPRGFYTGISGYFDGNKLDSAVMIRFIEQKGEEFLFRSGGGITTRSLPEDEYNEMIKKYMSLCVESLRIEEGRIFHVEFHNWRMNATRQELFGVTDKIDLRDWIDPAGSITRTKCRILYKETVEQVEYHPYQLRTIRTLRLVNSDTIDYRYKTADRSELDKLAALRGDADEILIVKNGLLTDTSFANIALWDGTVWITPAVPLLEGIHRAALLEKRELVMCDIPVAALSRYERIRIFNAMIGFGEIELPVTNLIRY